MWAATACASPTAWARWFPPRRNRISLQGGLLATALLWLGILATDHPTLRKATLDPSQDCQPRQELR